MGQQEWMAENLRVTRFRNGDPIFEIKSPDGWKRAGENCLPAFCRVPSCDGVGEDIIYNWFAVHDPRGLAPRGWRVAEVSDWVMILDQVEDLSRDEIPTEQWSVSEAESFLSQLNPESTVVRDALGNFEKLDSTGCCVFWCDRAFDYCSAYNWILDSGSEDMCLFGLLKASGLPVRCVRDSKISNAAWKEYYLDGLAKLYQTDYHHAMRAFSKSIELNRVNWKPYYHRAFLNLVFQDARAAIADYSKALEINNTLAKVYYWRGLAYFSLSERENGCADLRAAVGLGFGEAKSSLEDNCECLANTVKNP